ncbi:40s ribosomal protein s5-1 [Hordeum vulgare]|nr:40s ribosomal protein s5-1 [Hordeum vulgare]
MCEVVLHIWVVQGPKEGSEKARLAAVEHEIFKCQGMVEHGLSTNHSMITDFIREHNMDIKEIAKMIFKLHERLRDLLAQTYDLQNQNCKYEYHFKRMSIAADFKIPDTGSSFFNGESISWKTRDGLLLHHHHHPRRTLE